MADSGVVLHVWIYKVNAVNVELSVPVCGGFQAESVYVIDETPPSCSLLKLRLCLAASRTLAPCCTGPKGQKLSSDKASWVIKRANTIFRVYSHL